MELVSAIITTFHNEKFLSRAIECLINQTYRNIEIIVVDDNDPESDERRQTEHIMNKYPQVIYLKHIKNMNGASARNTGISVAKGKYIVFLDNDDIFFSTHIADCINALTVHVDCTAVFTSVVKVFEGHCWDIITPIQHDEVKTILLSERSLGTGSNLFVKADELRSVGGFDPSFERHQDIEFSLRYFQNNRSTAIEKVQIIKEMGGFSNTPCFTKFVEAKQHLWDNFKALISSLSEEERSRYFSTQYASLLYIACKEENRDEILWTIKNIRKYRHLTIKEMILTLLGGIHMFKVYEFMKKAVKICRSKELKASIEKQLSDIDVRVLNLALSEGRQ